MQSKIQRKSGFTLVEMMISVSISALVITAVMSTYIWIGDQAVVGRKLAWSQHEAMLTSSKITAYVRNASSIVDVDTEYGNWVDLGFADGTVRRLLYSNGRELQRDGRLYLLADGQTQSTDSPEELVVVRGMMAIPPKDGSGYSEHIFIAEPGDRTVRIGYRISKPNAVGVRAADDKDYAVTVRFSAHMRNVL